MLWMKLKLSPKYNSSPYLSRMTQLLWECGLDGWFLQAVQSTYCHSQSLVCFAGNKSSLFPVGVGPCQRCPLSLVLFKSFISRNSQMCPKGVSFGSLKILSTSQGWCGPTGLIRRLALRQIAASCNAAMIHHAMVLSLDRVPAPSGGAYCMYVRVVFPSRGEMEVNRWIGAGSSVIGILHCPSWSKRELSCEAELSIFPSFYIPTPTYVYELWAITKRTRSSFSFLCRMFGLCLIWWGDQTSRRGWK